MVIGVTIILRWAAGRYVLDPIAERAEPWVRGLWSAWKEGRPRPRDHILIRFDHATDGLEIEINKTADLAALGKTWQYAQQALDVCEVSEAQGIHLDKIRLLPDGTTDMLVVAYEGARPRYIVDLDKQTGAK